MRCAWSTSRRALQRGRRRWRSFPKARPATAAALLPFHANLLQAAIADRTPVQPVALRYADGTARFSPAVEYLGATSAAADDLAHRPLP